MNPATDDELKMARYVVDSDKPEARHELSGNTLGRILARLDRAELAAATLCHATRSCGYDCEQIDVAEAAAAVIEFAGGKGKAIDELSQRGARIKMLERALRDIQYSCLTDHRDHSAWAEWCQKVAEETLALESQR